MTVTGLTGVPGDVPWEEGEADVTRRELDDQEWAENVAAWEQDARDRVEAHE